MNIKTSNHNHSCQIDCTNHDEVINSLELKSKDLYYFWRNYEWLYNKYYNQQQVVQKQVKEPDRRNEIRELQQQNGRLTTDNRKLRSQNQSLRREIQILKTNPNSRKVQQQFQKQINRLNVKCKEYENIREKQSNQIMELNKKLKNKQEDLSDLLAKHQRELKRKDQIIVDLQTTIDSLRADSMKNGKKSDNEKVDIYEIQEKYRREFQRILSIMSSLEQRSAEIIQQEFDSTRQDLLKSFPSIMKRFSEGNMQHILIQQEQS